MTVNGCILTPYISTQMQAAAKALRNWNVVTTVGPVPCLQTSFVHIPKKTGGVWTAHRTCYLLMYNRHSRLASSEHGRYFTGFASHLYLLQASFVFHQCVLFMCSALKGRWWQEKILHRVCWIKVHVHCFSIRRKNSAGSSLVHLISDFHLNIIGSLTRLMQTIHVYFQVCKL
jgi:hypothetical protein